MKNLKKLLDLLPKKQKKKEKKKKRVFWLSIREKWLKEDQNSQLSTKTFGQLVQQASH
jgi:hypothetical protein